MDGAEAWLAAIKLFGAAIGAVLIGIAGLFAGKKRGGPSGEAQVVAGSFMERQALSDLTRAILNAHGTLLEILEELRDAKQARHDEKIAREAARAALAERGLRP